MSDKIDVEAFKKAGFTYDEMESVKKGLDDVENGRVFSEEEFYSRINKKLFSKNKIDA